MSMSINTFKVAVRALDLKLIAQAVSDFKAAQVSDSTIYRVAMAAEPSLDRGTWEDILKEAQAHSGA